MNEKENTIELRFDYYLDENDLEDIRIAAIKLTKMSMKGKVKVTIEFYPEGEENEELL